MKTYRLRVQQLTLLLGCLALNSGFALASDHSNGSRAEGVVSAISETSVTVNGTSYSLTDNSICENSAEQHIACSQVMSGDFVELRFDGNRVVQKLEVERSASASPTPSATPHNRHTRDDTRGRSGQRNLKVRLVTKAGLKVIKGLAQFETNRSRGRFVIQLKVPQTGQDLVKSVADAKALGLSATLKRAGVAYAECLLAFDDHELADDTTQPYYEFKVDIRSKKGVVSAKRGSCDIDLTQPDLQLGLPAVQAGDQILINQETVGTFMSRKFHK